LSAFYLKIPVGHVEAGLRTGNIHSPFPEEFNIKAIDSISSLCFCPTESNLQNLLREGKSEKSCFVTGNTVVDAIKHTVRNTQKKISPPIRILMTVHRRESLGDPMKNILRGVRRAAMKHSDAEITFPVHPNPIIKDIVNDVLGSPPSNLHLTPPMDVF
jgi:UDP-N-acetylglucosamine 2-epimerase (non-hydrolysing)